MDRKRKMIQHISLCREGFESQLGEELLARGSSTPSNFRAGKSPAPISVPIPVPILVREVGEGWLLWESGEEVPSAAARPLIFERQRLAHARHVRDGPVPALASLLARGDLPRMTAAPPPHTLHVFAPDNGGNAGNAGNAASTGSAGSAAGPSLAGKATRLEKALLEVWRKERPGLPPLLAPPAHPGGEWPGRGVSRSGESGESGGGTVWQVCLVPGGVWSACGPLGDLPDSHPGGVHRMRMSPGAPSRSYLKIEEALEVSGWRPMPRERAIDLGAAPGGWTFAFLQRGCRVLAVDNGPLKIAKVEDLPGELLHVREDGLRFRPPPGWLPADWLLGDMLIPPGVCLGLLRKWMEGGWARRFIVNVKLPQKHALKTLRPLMEMLDGIPGLAWRMRQLYHDRREVTLMGELSRKGSGFAPPSAAPSPGRPGKRRPSSKTSGSKRSGSKGSGSKGDATGGPPGKPKTRPGRGRHKKPAR